MAGKRILWLHSSAHARQSFFATLIWCPHVECFTFCIGEHTTSVLSMPVVTALLLGSSAQMVGVGLIKLKRLIAKAIG
jgi:hypothetical protein